MPFLTDNLIQSVSSYSAQQETRTSGTIYKAGGEDFNKLRRYNQQLVRTRFQFNWNFLLKIDGAPESFEFYIKDINYSLIDIATEEEQYGGSSFNWPTNAQAQHVSFTMRENEDGRNSKFFADWALLICNGSVVGLPYGENGYVRKITIYNLDSKGNESNFTNFYGYPSKVGEVSRAYQNGEFLEIPVTLTKFSSIHFTA